MQYLIPILILAAFLALFFFIKRETKVMKSRFYIFALSYRFIAAFALFLVYSEFYTNTENSDIFRFYKAGEEIQNIAVSEPKAYFELITGIDNHAKIFKSTIENNDFINEVSGNNSSIILLNSLISFLSFDSLFLHFIIFNIMAFLGLYWIHFFFIKIVPENKKLSAALIFFLPSMIFWSAGPLKEAVLIFLIGFILRLSVIDKIQLKNISNLILIILASYILFRFRALFALIFLGFYITFLINKFRNDKKPFISYAALIFIFFAFIMESDKILDKGILEMMYDKQQAFVELAKNDNSGSLSESPRITKEIKSLFTESPDAAVNLLLRPFPWKNHSLLNIFSFIENLLIIAIIIFTLIKSKSEIKNKNLLYFCMLMGLLLAMSYALIVPVIGALVRYKSIPILFLLLGIIQFSKDDNFKILKT